MSQLDPRGWARCCKEHHVESGRLCPQLVCWLIKKMPSRDAKEDDHGASSREGCFKSGNRGVFWRWRLSWVWRMAGGLKEFHEHWEDLDDVLAIPSVPSISKHRIRKETLKARGPLILNWGCTGESPGHLVFRMHVPSPTHDESKFQKQGLVTCLWSHCTAHEAQLGSRDDLRGGTGRRRGGKEAQEEADILQLIHAVIRRN